jgi:tetratricopeptide (TPR) repeat protein
MSKPAAIILPLVLLLLDYWKGRQITSKVIIEKIPFFLLSLLFGIITVKIQTPTALAGLEVFSITDRMLFAFYTLMIYFFRFFIPYPLSAYHPFPDMNNPGWLLLISPLFIIALLTFLWFMRRNKIIVFGFLFYIINLLLVLQVISIGLTIVSERYTYMPYVGLAFMTGILAAKYRKLPRKLLWSASVIFFAIFGFITYQRTQVWKNSGTLWSDVIKTFPETTYPRTNRANYVSILAENEKDKQLKDSLFRSALEDCNIALRIKPNLAAGYEKRGLIYLGLGMMNEAFADADSLVKLDPGNKIGYDIRGTVHYRRNEPEKAMENYNKCIEINPADHRSYNNRASIYLNFYNKNEEALVDINKAISINPLGNYYLSRSICYYKMGDMGKAKEDALTAIQKGSQVDAGYKSLLQLK